MSNSEGLGHLVSQMGGTVQGAGDALTEPDSELPCVTLGEVGKALSQASTEFPAISGGPQELVMDLLGKAVRRRKAQGTMDVVRESIAAEQNRNTPPGA